MFECAKRGREWISGKSLKAWLLEKKQNAKRSQQYRPETSGHRTLLDGRNTAEDVSPEDAKGAEPDQPVGNDLPRRAGGPNARFLFPGDPPDDRFQDAAAVERIARQRLKSARTRLM